jgi:AbrB family looped-hinge helix DNA binding protein
LDHILRAKLPIEPFKNRPRCRPFLAYNNGEVINMGELLKLKVSPKGQITLPKKVRNDLKIRDYIYLEIKDDKAEIKSVSLTDELEELIISDLKREGYAAAQIKSLLPEKKAQLAKALAHELHKRSREDTVTEAEALQELGLD